MQEELSLASDRTAIFLNTTTKHSSLLDTRSFIKEVGTLEVEGVVGPESQCGEEEEGNRHEFVHGNGITNEIFMKMIYE
jgi:hypothetical protein